MIPITPGSARMAITASLAGIALTMAAYGQSDPFTVDFEGVPTAGTAPLVVEFANLSEGDFHSYQWDFGDGTTSDDVATSHTYMDAGSYTVSLSALGPSRRQTRIREDYINVFDQVFAEFSHSPTSGTLPLDVTFVNESSGTFDTLLWNFGDGTTSGEDSPTHTYTEPGAYDVSLTATGNGGLGMRTVGDAVLVFSPVVAGFTADTTEGSRFLTVAFTNTSTGDFTGSEWTFGDGTASGETNPVHTYEGPGTYTVSLTVSGPGGEDSVTEEGYITVHPNRPPVAVIADGWRPWELEVAPRGNVVFTVSDSHDPDGDPLFFSWRESPGNPVKGLIPPESEHLDRIAITPPRVGRYEFDLVVSDGELTSEPVHINFWHYGLEGSVYNGSAGYGQPLPGTMMDFYRNEADAEQERRIAYSTVTDSHARYALEFLPDDFDDPKVRLRHQRLGSTDVLIIWTGTQRHDISLYFTPIEPFTGFVRDRQTGELLHGVNFQLFAAASGVGHSSSHADGAFYFSSIQARPHLMQARRTGYRPSVRQVQPMVGWTQKHYTLEQGGETGSFSGRIALQGTTLPVSGAEIRLGTVDGGTEVGPDGSYEIDNLPVGEYVVFVYHNGKNFRHASTLQIHPGKNELDLEVRQDDIPPVLYGFVLDETDERPVAGAVVIARTPDGAMGRHTVADMTGYYMLRGLPAGAKTLEVHAEGYTTTRVATGLYDTQFDFFLERDDDWEEQPRDFRTYPVAELTASLTELPTMTHPVVLNAGPRRPGRLYSWRESASNPATGLVPEGDSILNRLSITFPKPGIYHFGARIMEGGLASRNTAMVTVLVPGLMGTVSQSPSDGSHPIAGVEVRAYETLQAARDWTGGHLASVVSAGDGSYAITDLPAGHYWIAARDPEGVYNDYGPIGRNLEYGAHLADAEINMTRPTFRLEGNIHSNGEGSPTIERAHVIVFPGIRTDIFNTNTDANGRYMLPEFPGGGVDVMLVADGYVTRFEHVTIDEDSELTFFLDEATEGPATLEGRVTATFDGVALPIAHAHVRLGGTTLSTHTDRNGVYRFHDIPTGTYAGAIEREGFLPLRMDRDGLFELTPGVNTRDYTLELRGTPPVLFGEIRDPETGDPVEGARLRVLPLLEQLEAPVDSGGVLTDGTGYFALKGVPHGLRKVEVTLPGAKPFTMGLSVTGSARLSPLDLDFDNPPPPASAAQIISRLLSGQWEEGIDYDVNEDGAIDAGDVIRALGEE